VIVVDKCAPDGWLTEIIAREFGVPLIRTPDVLGAAGSRNAGIAAGSGQYVLPLDADDVLAPDYCARAVAVLEVRGEAGTCYCKTQVFGTGSWTWEPAPGWSLRNLIAANRLPNSCVYRQVCWEQAGGCTSGMEPCDEWKLWVAVARRGWTFQRIPECVVVMHATH
jgi:glycosyltransferase involved in cell wall biosynthesis